MITGDVIAELMLILALIGALWGVWWRIEGKVKVAYDRADTAHDRLSEHKLHVAETYVSKQGMREFRDEVMEAIQGVKGAVDHLGGRIDGIYHAGPPPRPRSTK